MTIFLAHLRHFHRLLCYLQPLAYPGHLAPAKPLCGKIPIPSPAPHYNFDEIPVVKCGPHELGNPALGDGKDFQYQTEELAKA